MAKKSKRQSRKSRSTSVRSAASVSNSTPASNISGSTAFDREFSPDYSETKKDLKRIGALAGSFFVVLMILSFFLR